jgi:hypothetical protein
MDELPTLRAHPTRRGRLTRKTVSGEGSKAVSPDKPLAELLKEQLLLLSSLVLIVGVAATDAYYATFSLGYQFLDLPANHLLFRGVTMLVTSPWLFTLYAIAILWLVADERLLSSRPSFARWRSAIGYAVIVVLLGLTFVMARWAGRQAAIRDLGRGSRLPRVVRLTTAHEQIDLSRGYRLLLSNSHFVVVFQPVDALDGGELPKIRQFSLESVETLETLPNATN